MTQETLIQWFWTKTWWSWNRTDALPRMWTDAACHYFNLLEASAWFVFAILVLARWLRFRRSALELWYSLAFATFGLSDVVEAWILTSWLLWWKLANLMVLIALRRRVIRTFYPDNRVY